jgi:hypothetical protein
VEDYLKKHASASTHSRERVGLRRRGPASGAPVCDKPAAFHSSRDNVGSQEGGGKPDDNAERRQRGESNSTDEEGGAER